MIRDRAAVVCTTILEIIDQTRGADLRRQLEQLLRDEFDDEKHQAIAERELPDA